MYLFHVGKRPKPPEINHYVMQLLARSFTWASGRSRLRFRWFNQSTAKEVSRGQAAEAA